MSDYSKYTNEQLINKIHELEKDLKNNKVYGLVWDREHTQEEVVLKCKNEMPILIDNDSLAVSNGGNCNLLIEGDNFHSLTCLNTIYQNKIKIIYIDPPYNTGNKDFTYNDSFLSADDGYRHSKWLSFMQKRLILARELMSDDGCIFISIDDHEVFQLKLLCDEIFGQSNYVGLMTLQSNPRGSQNSNFLSYVHEYVLMYAKNIRCLSTLGVDKDEESLKEFREVDENGRRYRLLGLRKRGGDWKKEDRPNMFFPIYINPINGKCSLTQDNDYVIEVIPKRPTGELSRWTWGREKFINESDLVVGKKVNRKNEPDAWDVFRKDYIDSETGEEKKTKLKTIWTEKEINYQNARNEIKDIFGNSEVFDYPKPTYLVKRLISIVKDNKDSIILDFFAGSGTTGHAVLDMNKEDNGNRKFILCTNNENNICSNVTYPRLKTIITGIKPDGTQYDSGLSSSLRYFKTQFINDCKDRDQAKYNLVEKINGLLSIVEDCYTEIGKTSYSYHYIGSSNKHMFIFNDFYSEEKFNSFANEVNLTKGEKIVYVFTIGNEVDSSISELLKDSVVKPVPTKIYEIYKEIVEDIKRGE